jgi:hypothetical protein
MSLFPNFFFCEKKQQNSMKKKTPLEQMLKTVIIMKK